MRKNTIVKLSHLLMLSKINESSIVIDATLGNGHDTYFLANKVKKVYGFDILDEAIKSSKTRNNEFSNIEYICDSHTNFANYINEPVDLIIYNLGYLPGYDKKYTTLAQSTLKSIEEGLKILNKFGKIIITVYIGHENGKLESSLIESFTTKLDKYKYDVLKHQLVNKDNFPPYILTINKK